MGRLKLPLKRRCIPKSRSMIESLRSQALLSCLQSLSQLPQRQDIMHR